MPNIQSYLVTPQFRLVILLHSECSVLEKLGNGETHYLSEENIDSAVHTCYDGYALYGASVTYCFNGVWSNTTLPSCILSGTIWKYTLTEYISRLSLSRSRRDPLKHFEISVLRHIRCAEWRKIPNEHPNFTNEHVI